MPSYYVICPSTSTRITLEYWCEEDKNSHDRTTRNKKDASIFTIEEAILAINGSGCEDHVYLQEVDTGLEIPYTLIRSDIPR